MNLPLPSENDALQEQLPLRHRPTRAREAEKIRQEFVESRKRTILEGCERSAKEISSDEQ